MKFVALVSGGKDSFYSIMECIRNGHDLLACAHLSPRNQNPDEDEESYMYQTAASECIPTLVEECLGMPLVIRECVGRSKNTSLVYDLGEKLDDTVEDEVEDLYELLLDVKRKFPDVQGISSGAILSTYQRTRIESVCGRLGLSSFGYLWRMGPQKDLLECMLKDGIEAVLVKVASPPGLMPMKHLNKTLGALYYGGVFGMLKTKFDFHICGEGGEYESLVLDCPIFRKKLVLVDVEIVEGDDGVGILKINKCEAVDKEEGAEIWQVAGAKLFERILSEDTDSPEPTNTLAMESNNPARRLPSAIHLPRIKVLPGGLGHISELVSQTIPDINDLQASDDVEADLAVLEAQSIFSTLEEALKRIQWTPERQKCGCAATAKDVVFVHIYLSNMSHFAKINQYYSAFFGTVLPPSRSCVAVGTNVLAGGRRVMMDCMIQRGSGEYMILPDLNLDAIETLSVVNAQFIKEHKMNPHHKLRSTLHVQSISHWAPICVGPYSQANTLRSGLHFMAGQIGLNPGTMTLVDGDWIQQLYQSWKNAASVLDALEGTLQDMIGGIVYIGSEIVKENGICQTKVWEACEKICRASVESNGGVIAGHVDETNENNELYGGFEDFETYREVMAAQNIDVDNMKQEQSTATAPFLMVAIPQMPVGAISEVELICATHRASTCLDMGIFRTGKHERNPISNHTDRGIHHTKGAIGWDSGCNGIDYSGADSTEITDEMSLTAVESVVQCIGNGCAAVAFTTATVLHPTESLPMHVDSIVLEMVDSTVLSLESSTGLGKFSGLHLRLFYIGTPGDDGSALRSALNMAVGCVWNSKPYSRQNHQVPALSLVPVEAMALSPSLSPGSTILAIQMIAADLVHMETEMWIRHNRTTSD